MTTTLIKDMRRKATMFAPEFVLPAMAATRTPKRGHKLVDLRSLGIVTGIAGGDGTGGYNAAADLVTETIDGFDLNDLWSEYQTAMSLQNEERQTLVDFLTFSVTNPQERVPQISSGDFERSSEYGEPRGIRPKVTQWTMGYDFEWYDVASRFTWRFLANSPRSQVDAINAMVIEADNRNVFTKVMAALFVNENREADIDGQQDVPVYSLYNGDGTVPPKYKSHTHDGTHTHYLVSGAAVLDSTDLDDMEEHLSHHGYNASNGMRLVVLMNSEQVKVARQFRVANGDSWDFIPAQGQPGFILPSDERLVGAQQVGPRLNGLEVVGTYGNLVLISEDLIPPGYMAAIATGGRANLNNPVGIREHRTASLRGLRLVKGPNPDYPLIDSFYNRGFGTGIRHRGGAVIMQIKAAGSYAPPAEYSEQV